MIRLFAVLTGLVVLMGVMWCCFAERAVAVAQVLSESDPLFCAPDTQLETEPETAEQSDCLLPYANIYARRLISFDGPFYEDKDAQELIGVAALELENTGNALVEYVEAVIYQEHRQLHFEATYIPPGGRVLVLEKDALCYDMERIVDFRCPKIVTADPNQPEDIQVQPEGECNVVVTNLSSSTEGCVRVFYKQYYEAEDLLIGGVTYCLVLSDLQPGESRSVSAYHFATRYSRIVCVRTQP